jgi:SAM-dependent methyltransferase
MAIIPMFSPGIYGSWQKIQREKFVEIKKRLGAVASEMFRGKLVLDIGCGFGYLEKNFVGEFIGIDIDVTMLRSKVADFPRVLGNGNLLPFTDGSFDSVVCIDTVHLLEGNDFLRVVKPGGLVMLSIFYNDRSYMDRKKCILDKLSSMEIMAEFEIPGREKEYVVVAKK